MKVFTIIIFLGISFIAYSQTKEELKFLSTHIPETEHSHFEEYTMDNSGSTQSVFGILFLFYKNFISSQDYNSCSFHPSCSVYALQAIKKQGLIPGILNAFDRLARCNGMSPEHYTINKEMHLLEDPLRNASYELPH